MHWSLSNSPVSAIKLVDVSAHAFEVRSASAWARPAISRRQKVVVSFEGPESRLLSPSDDESAFFRLFLQLTYLATSEDSFRHFLPGIMLIHETIRTCFHVFC